MQSNFLSSAELEDRLEKLLKIIEQTSPLPSGCDRKQVLDTIKDAVLKAYNDGVPKSIFTEKESFDQLLTISHTAVLENLTTHLAQTLHAQGNNAAMDPKTLETCRQLVKLAVKMQTGKEPDAKETDRLATIMLEKLQADMKKTPKPSPRPGKTEDLSDEDDYNAQMFGVTKNHIAVALQRAIGNTVGASDIAVLQSTAALAGFMFRVDNTAATLSADGRMALDTRLTAISGSFEGAHDALSAVVSRPRLEPHP